MASYQIQPKLSDIPTDEGSLKIYKKLKAMLGNTINRTSWSLTSNHTSPGFHIRSVNVGFVNDKVAVGQISLPVLTVFPL